MKKIYTGILLVALVIGLSVAANAITQETPKTKIWVEQDNESELIVGSMGKQMRIMAESKEPALVTYTARYQNAAVVPDPEIQQYTESKTVPVGKGITKISTIMAIDGKVDLQYSID